MAREKSPRQCGCGCGGMTKGGRFLPGHDAKLKGTLKRQARGGDEEAFSKLMSLGWASSSDRADYMGFQQVEVKPTTKEELPVVEQHILRCVICNVVLDKEEDRKYGSHCTDCYRGLTPANQLRALARIRYSDINDGAFERSWSKAMTWGWPTHQAVLDRMVVLAAACRPDVHENAIRTFHPSGGSNHRRRLRRIPCRCGNKFFIQAARVGNRHVLRCDAGCGAIKVRRVSSTAMLPAEEAFAVYPITADMHRRYVGMIEGLTEDILMYRGNHG